MMFAHPAVLLLLLIPAAGLFFGWKRHGHKVHLPFDHSPGATAKSWKNRGATTLLRSVHSLPMLLLAVAIVILAGPRTWGLPQDKRVMTNIEFLVDVSGSMTAEYGSGDRYEAAMDNMIDFIKARKGDAFGLIVFGDSVLEWVPITSDPSALSCAPEFLHPNKLPPWFSGGTSIGSALEHTLKVMTSRTDGDRMVILISDGYSWDLDSGNDVVIAKKLRAEGVQVFCIHIDTSEPPAEIATIANMTGGQVFSAGDPATLRTVFQRIDEMKKARFEKVGAESLDHFQPWTLLGGGLLLAYLLASLFGLRYAPW